jgi:hypothetical protein
MRGGKGLGKEKRKRKRERKEMFIGKEEYSIRIYKNI